MTLKELSQLYYLSREIEMDRERLERLRSELSAAKTPSYDDMPRASAFESGLERCIAEIVDLEAVIGEKIKRLSQERSRLESYIAEIPDSLTRQIFYLRFVECLPWVQIAFSVGGGNTEASVKMTCYRYLKKNQKK